MPNSVRRQWTIHCLRLLGKYKCLLHVSRKGIEACARAPDSLFLCVSQYLHTGHWVCVFVCSATGIHTIHDAYFLLKPRSYHRTSETLSAQNRYKRSP